jgi:stage V sporulation protein AF
MFLVPDSPGALPIILQLILVELAIDGLKIASMNTPDMLSNSLSVVGALILGDFAVEVGWMIPEVILYMAFVSVVSFAQPGVELGFAFKFLRIMLVILSALFGFFGFFGGIGLIVLMLCTNKTVAGTRFYLYPLIPFDGKKLKRLFFRTAKRE